MASRLYNVDIMFLIIHPLNDCFLLFLHPHPKLFHPSIPLAPSVAHDHQVIKSSRIWSLMFLFFPPNPGEHLLASSSVRLKVTLLFLALQPSGTLSAFLLQSKSCTCFFSFLNPSSLSAFSSSSCSSCLSLIFLWYLSSSTVTLEIQFWTHSCCSVVCPYSGTW